MKKLNRVRDMILWACSSLVLVLGATTNNVAAHKVGRDSFPGIQPHMETQRDDSAAKRVEGTWEGTLDAGAAKLKLVLHVVRKDGTLSASLDSPDQGATGLPIDTISISEGIVRFEMKALTAGYEGKLTNDDSQIDGTWAQGGVSIALVFKRASQTARESPLHLQKVDVGGHSLNLLIGSQATAAAPAVILEGGFGEGIAGWSTVQTEIAKFAPVVSYDRAGLGQSELGPKPRSAKQIALELHTALAKAGIKPPYVLVGHSLGGPYVRVFAGMYPSEVAGMVLIDPSQETFAAWTKIHPSPEFKDEEAKLAKAPEGPRDEYAAISVVYEQAQTARVPPGIPVTLLTAMQGQGISAEARQMWAEKHKEWIDKVPGGKLIVAEKSDHFIQVREPKLVIDAIREVVEKVRSKRP